MEVAHQRVQIDDDGVKADVIDLASANGLAVAILDGSGNQVTSFGGSGGTSSTDDAAFTAGSTAGTPMMGAATSDAVDAGDVGVVAMLTNRQLKVSLYDSSGAEVTNFGGGTEEQLDYDTGAGNVPLSVIGLALPGAGGPVAGGTTTNPIQVGDGGGSLTVDGTVGVSGTVTVDGSGVTQPVSNAGLTALNGAIAGTEVQVDVVGALPVGNNNIGDVDVATVPAPLSTAGGGTEATALRVTVASDSTGVLSVDDNGSSLTVDNAVLEGWDNAASDGASVSGDVAHDAADAGEPVKIGFKAASALPTAVASADRANGVSDLWGRQLTSHIDPAMQTWKSFNATAAQTGTDVWSPTSGKKIAITSITIGTYGTTAARLILWFGDNADTTYSAGTDQLVFAGSYAPSATSKPGTVLVFNTPVFCTTADRELHITTDAALSVDVTVYGYEW